MVGGRGGMGIRKHRQVKVHGNVTPSGPTKLAIRRAIAALTPRPRMRSTFYPTVQALFAAERRRR